MSNAVLSHLTQNSLANFKKIKSVLKQLKTENWKRNSLKHNNLGEWTDDCWRNHIEFFYLFHRKTPFSSIVDCNVIPQTSRINRGCTEQWGKNGFSHFLIFFCGFPSKRKKIDSFAFFITRIFSTFTHLSGFLEIILWGIEIESTKSISKEQWKGIYIILKEYCTGLELRLQSMSMEYWKESKDKTDQIHFNIE